jgi:hypothetical protein
VDSPSSLIALQVFHKSTVGKNKCLAKANIGITHLLEKCRLNEGQKGKTRSFFYLRGSDAITVDFSVVLNHVEKNATGMEGPTLVVRMTSIGHIQAGEVALANATQDIVPLEGVGARSAVVKIVGVGVERSDLLSGLETVLSRVNIVLRIGAEVAKVRN